MNTFNLAHEYDMLKSAYLKLQKEYSKMEDEYLKMAHQNRVLKAEIEKLKKDNSTF